jgi:hypothetical protein
MFFTLARSKIPGGAQVFRPARTKKRAREKSHARVTYSTFFDVRTPILRSF